MYAYGNSCYCIKQKASFLEMFQIMDYIKCKECGFVVRSKDNKKAEGHAQRRGLAQHRYTQNHCGEAQGTQNGGRGAAYEEYRCCGADE